MPDIGNTLREARIRKGLSITDVESVTKIRSKYLEALEDNDFEVLPGPTVVKGFLRSYAIFLKLDPEVMLAEYRSKYEHHVEELGTLRTEMSQQQRTRTSAERKKKRTRRTQRGYVAAGLIAVVAIVLLAWFGSGRGQDLASIDGSNLSSSTLTTRASSATTVSIAVENSSTSSTNPAGSSTSTSAGTATTTGENVTMVLSVAQGSCWLVVREDNESGAELYAGTLSAGGQQTFDSAKRYWVMAGIPDALTISVNGTPYSLSGPAGAFLVTETGVERVQ